MKKIDEFEDEGEFYKRKEVEVILDDGRKIKVWVYIYFCEVDENNYILFEN